LEISVGFFRGDLLHPTLDTDLAAKLGPKEKKAGDRLVSHLPALLALIIREKNESIPVESLEKDHAGRGSAGLGHGGNSESVGVQSLGFEGFLEPFLEKDQRVAGRVLLEERAVAVFAA
jgi:hypothetical protein